MWWRPVRVQRIAALATTNQNQVGVTMDTVLQVKVIPLRIRGTGIDWVRMPYFWKGCFVMSEKMEYTQAYAKVILFDNSDVVTVSGSENGGCWRPSWDGSCGTVSSSCAGQAISGI